MSTRIDDILEILAGIRNGYDANKREPLRTLRIAVVCEIAERRKVERNTIQDKYIRGLAPNIKGTKTFDRRVEEWLTAGSRDLQLALEHDADQNDKKRIQEFFEQT